MRFIERKEYWFAPDMDVVDDSGRTVKNRDLPKSKQLQGLINRPDPEVRAELQNTDVARDFSSKAVEDAKKGSDEAPTKKRLVFSNRMDTGRILREHVIKLRNVEVEVQDLDGKNSGIKTLETGADLVGSKAFGIDILVQKLCAEVLRDKLPEQMEKNSEPQPSST